MSAVGPQVVRAGRLLVANPLLPDPNFDRTVVLLLAYGEDGAVGLVLNRPSQMDVADPLAQWEHLAASPAVVFVGGPVQHQAVICLARPGVPGDGPDGLAAVDGWTEVVPDVGTVDLELDPDAVGSTVREVRIFAGYAGWAAGQLESEVRAGAWWVVDAEPDDPFDPDPGELWKRVLRRQRGSLGLVAYFPDDPTSN